MALPIDGLRLSQVRDEIGLSPNASLTDCFANANEDGFDPTYVGNRDRLSNFRGYEHVLATPPSNPDSSGIHINADIYCDGDDNITSAEVTVTIDESAIDVPNTTRFRLEVHPDNWSVVVGNGDYSGSGDFSIVMHTEGPGVTDRMTFVVYVVAYNGDIPSDEDPSGGFVIVTC